MKHYISLFILVILAPQAYAGPSFGPAYFEWKKCVNENECSLVSAPPPCACGPDSINKKYLKAYEQKFAEISRYWKGRKDAPSCEPCRPTIDKTSFKVKCKNVCYTEPSN